MNRVISFCLLILLILSSNACRKDNNFSVIDKTPPIPEITILAKASGFIKLENGNYLPEAIIRLGDQQVESDSNGYYKIEAYVNAEKAILTIEKPFFETLFLSFIPEENGINRINAKTYKPNFVSIPGTTTGEVIMPKEEIVHFSDNSFKDQLGNIYTDQVKFYVGSPALDRPDFFESIAGDLQGIDSNGDLKVLEPFGISNIQVEDEFYQPLLLNNSISIKMFKPFSNMISSAGEIPLWRYDQIAGLWQEKGVAILDGEQYIAEIDETGYWIAAMATNSIELKGTITYNNTFPEAKVSISATANTGNNRKLPTSESGQFIGRFSADENLILEIQSPCGDFIYEKELGSFSEDSDLGTLDLNLDSEASLTFSLGISGMVMDCTGQLATGGYVLIKTFEPELFYQLPIQSNGSFSGSILTCNENQISVSAIDLEASSAGVPSTFDPANSVDVIAANTLLNCFDGSSSVVFTYEGETTVFPGCSIAVTVTDSIDYRMRFTHFQQFGHVDYEIRILDINGNPTNPNYMSFGFALEGSYGSVDNVYDFNFPAQITDFQYADQSGETVIFSFANLDVIKDGNWSSNETMTVTAIVE